MAINKSVVNYYQILQLLLNGMLLALPVISLYVLYLLIFWSDSGFDITDEAYYLLSSAQAEDVFLATSQFGHYTGFLFDLAGQDITLFRQLGILVLLAVSGVFSFQLQQYWKYTQGDIGIFTSSLVHLVIVMSSLNYYGQWMLTPSYNWLLLIGILITLSALLSSATRPASYLHFLMIGFGGAITFFAKAPSAIFLAIITVVWFLSHPKKYIAKNYFIGSGVAAIGWLLLHTFIFDSGPLDTIQEIYKGQQAAALMGGGHTFVHIVTKFFIDISLLPSIVVKLSIWGFFLLPFVLWINSLDKMKQYFNYYPIIIFTLIMFLSVWFSLLDQNIWSILRAGYGYVTIAVIMLLISMVNKRYPTQVDNEVKNIVLKTLPVHLLLFLSAFAFAFGSTRSTFQQLSLVSMFLVTSTIYSGLTIDKVIQKRIFAPLSLLYGSVTLLLVITFAFYNPYRLNGSVEEQTELVSFLGNTSEIKVEPKTASYIIEIQKIAISSGWSVDDLIIDLTGGSPGASFILGSKTLPTPWLLGGYPGSLEMAKYILFEVPKDKVEHAWLLTAPDGNRKLSENIFVSLGLNFPENYTKLGEIETGHRNEKQILWKPHVSSLQLDVE